MRTIEKEQVVKTEETNTEAEYSFYSKKLNKVFESVADLKAAEAKLEEEQKAKLEAANNKKADAVKVEDAFKAYNVAKKEYNENVLAAKKDYLKKKADLDAKYNEVVNKYSDAIESAEQSYNAAVKEFTDKHPEGYHVTLRDGDNVTTLYKETRGLRPSITSSVWDDFFSFLNRF